LKGGGGCFCGAVAWDEFDDFSAEGNEDFVHDDGEEDVGVGGACLGFGVFDGLGGERMQTTGGGCTSSMMYLYWGIWAAA
jgi:hypothetical protein